LPGEASRVIPVKQSNNSPTAFQKSRKEEGAMLLRRLAFRRLPVFLYCCLLLGSLLSTATPAVSEVTLDGSLGSRGPVSSGTLPNGTQTTYLISDNLGRRAGGNLFHSFDRFNIYSGESASFTGPNDISNIISRVTGGTQSWIDGTLRSTINGANLFLLNPSGVLFGPNASLDVRGSFHMSTADYLKFGDGGIFYANPNVSSVLSVAPVESFGFLSANPAPISIERSTLQVPEGKTLSVIGGNISVTSGSAGYLSAPGGQVHLASVASPGEVMPTASSGPQVSSFERLGDVSLTGAYVDASGASGGSVFIRGGRLVFTNSTVLANTVGANGAPIGADIRVRGDLSMNNSMLQVATTGAGNAGDINIESSEFQMRNMAIIGDITTGTGRGGNLEVMTGSLSMIEGAQLLVSTYGAGNSGNLKITADTATLSSADNFSRPAALFANTRTGSTGRGGDMELNIGDLTLLKGAQMDTTTSGRGNAGQLTINADSILFSGKNGRNAVAGLFARTMANPGGNAGPVTINTGSLEVRDGAQISSGSYGGGNGGSLVINADRVLISTKDNTGTTWNNSTGIFKRGSYGSSGAMTITAGDLQILDGGTVNTLIDRSGAGADTVLNADRILISGATPGGIGSMVYYSTSTTATGAMGNVKVNCDSLDVTAGGQVYVKNIGSGTSGNLEINAGSILLTPVDSAGVNTNRTTGLLAQGSTKDAGKISIHADSLSILDGARIDTIASGAGHGGDVEITAGRVLISGTNTLSSRTPSMIASQSTSPYTTGGSGNVKIIADSFELTDGGWITVGTQGKGNAGSIMIEADTILIRSQPGNLATSTGISASTSSSGDGGSIQLKAGSIELIDRADVASITSGAGKGGAVTISADRMEVYSTSSAAPDLSASTSGAGSGGTIHIEARDLRLGQLSTLGASSSGPGNGGAVEIVSDHLSMSVLSEIQTGSSGSGAAGSVNITAGTIDMQTASSIAASTTGAGSGGSINISADTMTMRGSSLRSTSSGGGSAGQINVSSQTLDLNNADIRVSSAGTANAGAINVNVNQLTLAAGSTIYAESMDGQGGDIHIHASRSIDISSDLSTYPFRESVISTSAMGAGEAGAIELTSPTLSITNHSYITSNSLGRGNAGRIELSVMDLNMDSAIVSSGSYGEGKGGKITIHADGAISMSDRSSVTTSSLRSGDAGQIELRAGRIELQDMSTISSRAEGTADAGSVNIISADQFTLQNSTVSTLANEGNGGNITVQAGTVKLIDQSRISASGWGAGNAGDIQITASDSLTLKGSVLTAVAPESDGGNINIKAGNMVRLADSTISTSVGGGPQTTGGKIDIDPNYVILARSQILANAYEGHGGSVKIVANTFLSDPQSAVSASSTLGVDGTVDIQAVISNVSGLLSPLSQEFVNATALLREPCMARLKGGKYSSFIVGGRDALPLEPGGPLPGMMR
jgi:filamentous hemagglutinin family protein